MTLSAVLEFFNDEKIEPDEQLLRTLRGVGTQVGQVLERKRAEEFLSNVLDNIPTPVYLRDPDGKFLLVNREYEKIHEVSRENIQSKCLSEIFPSELADEFAINDKDVIQRREVLVREENFERSDGSTIIFTAIKFPLVDLSGSIIGVGGVDFDITDRVNAEKQLASKEAQLRTTLENMPGGLKAIDDDLNYVLINPKYSELYGFPDDLLEVGDSMHKELLYQAERGDLGEGEPEELVAGIIARYQEAETTAEPVSFERVVSGRPHASDQHCANRSGRRRDYRHRHYGSEGSGAHHGGGKGCQPSPPPRPRAISSPT